MYISHSFPISFFDFENIYMVIEKTYFLFEYIEFLLD